MGNDWEEQPPPLPVSDADYEREQALDWVAPEDDSRLRIALFKFLPVLFLCLFAFAPAWTGGFVWQDATQVTANSQLRSGTGLGKIWSSPGVTPTWGPVAYSILWPQQMIWSEKSPVGYHLVCLVLHTCNAMLVWMLMKRIGMVAPFVIALVFALHPMQTESVSWIAQQPMLLGFFWGLCFCLTYWRWSGADLSVINPTRIFRLPYGPKKLYTLALITFALALMSSPIAVCTLPIVMAMLVWWKLDGIDRRNVIGLLPLVLMAAGVLIFNAILEQRRHNVSWPYGVIGSILLATHSVWFYLHQFFWPIGQTVLHKDFSLNGGDVISWAALAGLILLAAVLYLRRLEIGKGVIAGIVIFVLLLLPLISPINWAAIQLSYISERYQYLACAVLAAMVVSAIAQSARRFVRDERWPAPAAVAVLLIVLTSTDFFGYSNSFVSGTALWLNAANRDNDNVAAMVHLAQVYEKQKDTLDQAVRLYQRVLRLSDRKNVEALLGLGALVEDHDVNEAASYYREAMTIAPDRTEPIRSLGPALVKQKKALEAIELYQQAIKRFPSDYTLYDLKGRAQASLSKFDDAIASYEKAIDLNSYDTGTRLDLATVYFAKKDYANVGKQIDEAFQLDPRNYDLYMNLGEMFTLGNDLDRALGCFRSAVYLKSDRPEPCNNVGFVLTRQSLFFWQKRQPAMAHDKIKEALVYFQKALTIQPDFESAKKNLKTAMYIQASVLDTAPPATKPSGPSTTPSVEK